MTYKSKFKLILKLWKKSTSKITKQVVIYGRGMASVKNKRVNPTIQSQIIILVCSYSSTCCSVPLCLVQFAHQSFIFNSAPLLFFSPAECPWAWSSPASRGSHIDSHLQKHRPSMLRTLPNLVIPQKKGRGEYAVPIMILWSNSLVYVLHFKYLPAGPLVLQFGTWNPSWTAALFPGRAAERAMFESGAQ